MNDKDLEIQFYKDIAKNFQDAAEEAMGDVCKTQAELDELKAKFDALDCVYKGKYIKLEELYKNEREKRMRLEGDLFIKSNLIGKYRDRIVQLYEFAFNPPKGYNE